MRAVVTGAAGLIGSHLCEALVARGDHVVGIDNFLTGQRENLSSLGSSPRWTLLEQDVTDRDGLRVEGPVDVVVHLASAASPRDFESKPLEILRAGSLGTFATLDLARLHGARHVLASTSEVYGEPLVHPQREEHWGNVNPVGPRACYDESKRFAEATASTYARSFGVDSGIARIFNTYGPRMRVDDGRVVSNFVVQALRGEPLTVHGDGSQTRSFCFVDDQVRGLTAMIDASQPGPINLGNPEEFTVLELAKLVLDLTGATAEVRHLPMPEDDPTQRRPDIARAHELLGFEPTVSLEAGLTRTIDYFRARLGVT